MPKEIAPRGEISKRDLAKGRNLAIAAVTSPLVLAGVPAVVSLLLLLIFSWTPPVAATIFFFGLLLTIVCAVVGVSLSGFFLFRRSAWTRDMRERIAANGIKAEEISWFRHELKSSEKRALADISRRDLLLADAYRETLASRLTATRIVRSSKKELLAAQRRKNKLKYSKSKSLSKFQEQIEDDVRKIGEINVEAKEMLGEAEARLQMIEAAAVRGTSLAESELALKKLSARAAEIPLALEAVKMQEEIRKELEEMDDEPDELVSEREPQKPFERTN
ncbi:MAG TPA: hypothetical protein VHQ01_01185 [Pyrinomonadaceae bacterium]|jgi:hypothetical protein|nr:hypothetical protein [Pyrinomonadaceae bacterium]